MNIPIKIIFKGLFVLIFCLASSEGWASQCRTFELSQPLSERYAQADVAFLGKVMYVEYTKGKSPHFFEGNVYHMDIVERFKGKIRGQVEVGTSGGRMMAVDLKVGDEVFIISKYQNGKIMMWHCDQAYFKDKPNNEVLEELRKIKKGKSIWPWKHW